MNTLTALPLGAALVLAPPADDRRAPLFVLGPMGQAIWHGLATGGEPAAAARLAADFALDPAAAVQAVAAAVRAWRAADRPPARPHPSARAALPPVARQRIYALCGRPVAVRFAARAVEALVAPRFAGSECPGRLPEATLTLARTRRGFVLREEGQPDRAASDAVAMSGLFTRRFAEISHATADWLAVLHAAAVADARGAIVLPGPNGAGKSTLTAALVARGFAYFSDDCVPIAVDGRVRPVPFALCHKTRTASGALRLSYQPPPATLPCPAAPRLFLFPRYQAGGSRPAARRLDPPEVLERLVAGRAWLSRRPEHLAEALALLARCPALELTYSSLAEAFALFDAIDDEARAA